MRSKLRNHEVLVELIPVFQFRHGAIKTRVRVLVQIGFHRFQFRHGAIKTRSLDGYVMFAYRFNSDTVRSKPDIATDQHAPRRGFNSDTVRSKHMIFLPRCYRLLVSIPTRCDQNVKQSGEGSSNPLVSIPTRCDQNTGKWRTP